MKNLRKTTFNKRKKGLLKKLDELMTLCDVKACAVLYSPYNSTLEAWPSRQGVEEVVSKFMEFSVREQTKKMVDQEAFIRQMIDKEKVKLHKLRDENRNSRIRDCMFGCLKGEIDVCHLDQRDLRDLSSFIDKYVNDLTRRIEILTKNASPIRRNDQNQNQRKQVQFQYKALFDFYDHIPQKIHDFNMNMNMNMNSNQNMTLDLNQNLNVGEHEDILSMDSNHQQPEIDCLATITNVDADVCAPNITNNV